MSYSSDGVAAPKCQVTFRLKFVTLSPVRVFSANAGQAAVKGWLFLKSLSAAANLGLRPHMV